MSDVRVNVKCLWLGNGVNFRFVGCNLGSVLALRLGLLLGERVNARYYYLVNIMLGVKVSVRY